LRKSRKTLKMSRTMLAAIATAPGPAAQIAPEVRPERGECDRDGDEPHDLPEQLPGAVV
jgi:hypothetical protein